MLPRESVVARIPHSVIQIAYDCGMMTTTVKLTPGNPLQVLRLLRESGIPIESMKITEDGIIILGENDHELLPWGHDVRIESHG